MNRIKFFDYIEWEYKFNEYYNTKFLSIKDIQSNDELLERINNIINLNGLSSIYKKSNLNLNINDDELITLINEFELKSKTYNSLQRNFVAGIIHEVNLTECYLDLCMIVYYLILKSQNITTALKYKFLFEKVVSVRKIIWPIADYEFENMIIYDVFENISEVFGCDLNNLPSIYEKNDVNLNITFDEFEQRINDFLEWNNPEDFYVVRIKTNYNDKKSIISIMTHRINMHHEFLNLTMITYYLVLKSNNIIEIDNNYDSESYQSLFSAIDEGQYNDSFRSISSDLNNIISLKLAMLSKDIKKIKLIENPVCFYELIEYRKNIRDRLNIIFNG